MRAGSKINWHKYPIQRLRSLQELYNAKGVNALIYFPHGLGDIAMFTSIARFFTAGGNRLFFTRHGDDYVAATAGAHYLTPIYSGLRNPHTDDGGMLGHKHFGITANSTDISVTAPMFAQLLAHKITHVLREPFYEPYSGSKFPLHSKQRICLSPLYSSLSADDRELLNFPLEPGINVTPDAAVLDAVSARLSSATDWRPGYPLFVITRYGATSSGKNWGHLFRDGSFPKEGDEARELINLCRQKNPRVVFISMEHLGITGVNSLCNPAQRVYSYAKLFAPPSDDAFAVPYVVILRAIFHLATAHIGVPTGATGIAQQHENLLNIMLWIELSPEKYFEPRSNAVNIVSNNQPERRRSLNELPTAVAKNYNFSFVNTPGIAGKEVFKYVEHLL